MDCTNFNSPAIINWNIANIVNLQGIFAYAILFNQPIGGWDTSNVTNMSYMFYRASAFNQDISVWETSAVEDMSHMFEDATIFNNGQTGTVDISGNLNTLPAFYTNTSKLLTCTGASFRTLTSADVLIITTPALVYSSQIQTTPVSDVSLVLFTAYGSDILSGITSIKKQVAGTADLSWNTQLVTTTANMFQNATYFNQRLPWNMRLNRNVTSMFAGTATTFINLFNNGQILTGTTQQLYDASLIPLPNTWDFSNNGVISTTWRANSKLITGTGNGITINPVLTSA